MLTRQAKLLLGQLLLAQCSGPSSIYDKFARALTDAVNNLKVGDGFGEGVIQVDWDGYTIGYYGRIFEARNKTKGGSFEGDDKAFYKFKLGSHEVLLEGYGGTYTSTLKKNQAKAIILHMLVNKRMMATLGLTLRLQLL